MSTKAFTTMTGNITSYQRRSGVNSTIGGTDQSSDPSSSDDTSEDTENDTGGLTRANKIAIGVGVGIVLPSCLASVINLLIRIRELRQELRDVKKKATETEDIELEHGFEKIESVIYQSGSPKWRFRFNFPHFRGFWTRNRR